MSAPVQTIVTCPKCRTRFPATVEQLLDVEHDPSAKARLISGQVNVTRCPNCNFQVNMGTLLAYHDPAKELLLIHVPMEINMNQQEQEQAIGRLLRSITDNLPLERRKGYLLNPRRSLTLQGMVETILQADGITKEMLEARRKKLALVETFMRTPPDQLESTAAKHDTELDEEFFSMLASTAQAIMMDGKQEAAEQIMALSDLLMQYSSYGKQMLAELQLQEQALQKVTRDLNQFGNKVTRDKLVDLIISYDEHEEYLHALVALVRPALDYQVLQELSKRADEDKSKKVRVKARRVRDILVELLKEADAQSQMLVQQAGAVLQEIVNSPDLEAAIRQYVPQIDNVFMAVLEANLQESQKQNNEALFQRLQQVHMIISAMIMESSPPEVRFINELLRTEDVLEARLMLLDRAAEFGPRLLEYLDALIAQLEERGEAGLIQRLEELRGEAEKILSP